MPDEFTIPWDFSHPDTKQRWPYDRWFRTHIGKRIRYGYVRQHWDIATLAVSQMDRWRAEPHDPGAPRLTDVDRALMRKLHESGFEVLMPFLDAVDTHAKAEPFCKARTINPLDLMNLLERVRKYLPTGANMRSLVDKSDTVSQGYVDLLVKHKLGHSLALLNMARTPAERAQLVELTGIPADGLLDLVRRADLTRLHLMGGGMIRTQWALGYKGLRAIQQASPEDYHAACVAYYERTAKGMPGDFTMQNVISHIQRMKEAWTYLEE